MFKESAGGTQASAHHCWQSVSTATAGGPTSCPDEVVWAGTYTYANGETWLAFSCDGHEGKLQNIRALTPDDRNELNRRVKSHAAALRGERWIPPTPLRQATRRR